MGTSPSVSLPLPPAVPNPRLWKQPSWVGLPLLLPAAAFFWVPGVIDISFFPAAAGLCGREAPKAKKTLGGWVAHMQGLSSRKEEEEEEVSAGRQFLQVDNLEVCLPLPLSAERAEGSEGIHGTAKDRTFSDFFCIEGKSLKAFDFFMTVFS